MGSSSITRRTALKLAGAAGALGLIGGPAAALADSDGGDNKLYIGMDLHGIGPGQTTGTFVASGRVNDAGPSNAQPVLSPMPGGERDHLEGDQQFIGSKGTLLTHFEGVAFPSGSPNAVGEGRVTIVGGTGAYAGMRGTGSFRIVVNFLVNQLIGTEVITLEGL